jgi:hypothetical protein
VAVNVVRYLAGEGVNLDIYAQPRLLWVCPLEPLGDSAKYMSAEAHGWQFTHDMLRFDFTCIGEVTPDRYSSTDLGDLADLVELETDDLGVQVVFGPSAVELAEMALARLGDEGESVTFITLWRYAEDVDEETELAGDPSWALLGLVDLHQVANLVLQS